ncbi:primosomal replication protein N [Nitrococcus mobilis]|uniref:Replication restart protein PriB n=1 Tax=Nitrococcus mobilis Nb-231 TaxID=314278 RepID=A4BM01_9GAMM|nr:primosomal replication protein N [Nitrococcus mobilis]EAR23339.1 primosomal replication protein N [Nitrococcus mobilis Nb-231]
MAETRSEYALTPRDSHVNVVTLTGALVAPAELRYSPAGIPIARFLLEHFSEQSEAGAHRPVRLRIGVRASGQPLAEALQGVSAGTCLRVVGFLIRSRQRSGEYPLIISASQIERLAS